MISQSQLFFQHMVLYSDGCHVFVVYTNHSFFFLYYTQRNCQMKHVFHHCWGGTNHLSRGETDFALTFQRQTFNKYNFYPNIYHYKIKCYIQEISVLQGSNIIIIKLDNLKYCSSCTVPDTVRRKTTNPLAAALKLKAAPLISVCYNIQILFSTSARRFISCT